MNVFLIIRWLARLFAHTERQHVPVRVSPRKFIK